MNEHNNEQEWEKLKQALYPPPPTSEETEQFVKSVMAKLPAGQEKRAFNWEGFWWKAPALAFGVLAISIAGPNLVDPSSVNEPFLCTQTLLLESDSSGRLLQGEHAATDDVVRLLWETEE